MGKVLVCMGAAYGQDGREQPKRRLTFIEYLWHARHLPSVITFSFHISPCVGVNVLIVEVTAGTQTGQVTGSRSHREALAGPGFEPGSL